MISNIEKQIKLKRELNILQKAIKDVDGWLTLSEADCLYLLALNSSEKGVIVEIGSYKGKSTICLATGSKNNNNTPVYSIDPHEGAGTGVPTVENPVWTHDEFMSNIKNAGVEDIITSFVNTSEKVSKEFDKPISLIFIDGAHDYESVKLDFELWSPKVIKNGVIAFHDASHAPGVIKLIKEQVENSPNFSEIKYIDTIAYVEKFN